MNVIYLLLPLALLLGFGFLAAFVWFARQGQYDDLETPAYRILFETHERKVSDDGTGNTA